jgi:hypothetical protein
MWSDSFIILFHSRQFNGSLFINFDIFLLSSSEMWKTLFWMNKRWKVHNTLWHDKNQNCYHAQNIKNMCNFLCCMICILLQVSWILQNVKKPAWGILRNSYPDALSQRAKYCVLSRFDYLIRHLKQLLYYICYCLYCYVIWSAVIKLISTKI